MAKLYGVGVGPGESGLITLKAVKILKNADVIAVPSAGGARTAFDTAREFIDENKVLDCAVPMTKDKARLDAAYKKIADDIETRLKAGRDTAFITLGDPSVYSTYTRVRDILTKRGYACETVPAVTSFCAAAARLETTLCEGDEPLIIIPAGCKDIGSLLDQSGTKVIMKSGGKLGEIKALLSEKGLAGRAVMAEKCGMDGEKIYTDIETADNDKSYFSVIIVR